MASASLAAGWGSPALPFLAVGRVKGSKVLAFHTTSAECKDLYREIFQKLLTVAAERLTNGQRTRLQWGNGSVCCLMDQQGTFLYVVMTAVVVYPERLAYQLLYDFAVVVQQHESKQGALEDEKSAEPMVPRLRELVAWYEDPENFPSDQSRRFSQPGMSHLALRPTPFQRQRATFFKVGLVVVALILIAFIPHFFDHWHSSSNRVPDPQEAPDEAVDSVSTALDEDGRLGPEDAMATSGDAGEADIEVGDEILEETTERKDFVQDSTQETQGTVGKRFMRWALSKF